MRRRIVRLGGALAGALAAAAMVAACGTLGSREADRYFVLQPGPPSGAPSPAAIAVVVAATSVASFYDTQDIVYSRAPGARAYYQFSHWTERPHHAVHAQLVARFGAGASQRGPILATQVVEIYHDAIQQPGAARIEIAAQLVDPVSRAVIAQRAFIATAPATSYDAAGAVAGISRALGAVLDDIVAWTAAQMPGVARPGS